MKDETIVGTCSGPDMSIFTSRRVKRICGGPIVLGVMMVDGMPGQAACRICGKKTEGRFGAFLPMVHPVEVKEDK